MNQALKSSNEYKINTTMANLRKNGMESYYVSETADVRSKVEELIKPGQVVGVGGSVTLIETGVIDMLKSGRYEYLDRAIPGLTPEEIRSVYVRCFDADTYISSANAITMNGELYNVDGRSNRVAAICYGPRSVIIVAGVNKIVPDIETAVKRVKMTAAPANCIRLKKKRIVLRRDIAKEWTTTILQQAV